MSDLLKRKKPKIIPRQQPIEPKEKFTLDSLEEKKPVRPSVKKTVRETQTSIRINVSTRDRLNAMVTMGAGRTVNELLDTMISEFEDIRFTDEERIEYEMILKAYSRKPK